MLEKASIYCISKFCLRSDGVFKMVDYSKIEEEIESMEPGQKKPFGASYTTEEFQGVYKFLLKLQGEGIIYVKPHIESKSGLRQVDAAFVTKL